MSSDNRITDAKTVTAVGAALYQAVRNGKIERWRINRSNRQSSREYFWCAMPARGRNRGRREPYLIPGCEEVTVEIMIGTGIGRKSLASVAKPEQVYRLRWTEQGKPKTGAVNETLRVTMRRKASKHPGGIEEIDLVAVEPVEGGRPVGLGDVELQMCTLEDEEFWLDSGKFEVVWS